MSTPSEPGKAPETRAASESDSSTPAWRRPTAIVAIALAGILMFAGSLAVWAERQALSTDNWTTTSTDLLEDDEVRLALSRYLVDTALAETDIAAEVRDRVPPALRPVAGQLVGALRGGAINVADEILASGAVQTLWLEANRTAHRALVLLIDNDAESRGAVTLALRPVVAQLRERLGLPAADPDAGLLVIMRSDQLETAQRAASLLRSLAIALPIAVLILIAAAIWLAAGWRRGAVRALAWTAVTVGLALLLTRRLVGRQLVDSLVTAPAADPAAESAWSIATTLLFDMALATIIVGVLVALGTWITGDNHRAVTLRSRVAPTFRSNPVATWAAFVVVALLILVLLPDTGRRFWGTLVLLALLIGGLGYFRYVSLQENPSDDSPAERNPS